MPETNANRSCATCINSISRLEANFPKDADEGIIAVCNEGGYTEMGEEAYLRERSEEECNAWKVKAKASLCLVKTISFSEEIPEPVQARIMGYALGRINVKTNFVAFCPEEEGIKEHYEDDGRSLITSMEGLRKKAYAKLDDYGETSQWDEMYGKETADRLREAPNTRFVVTLMLAEEY